MSRKEKPLLPFEGHRKRLRGRFRDGGISALHSHEIVELLLTYVLPRRDTKPAARELVRKYRSLNAVLNASPEELMAVEGIGVRSAELFALIREVNVLCLKERYQRGSLIAHRRDAEEYLRMRFGFRSDEYFAAIFLGNRHRVIETEVIAEGTVNQCAVFPRVIVEKALRHHASSILVAHNHPGGGMTASEQDWRLTEELFKACEVLNIGLLDHLVIAQEKVLSLRDLPRWPGSNRP